jgi:hypothetical protein
VRGHRFRVLVIAEFGCALKQVNALADLVQAPLHLGDRPPQMGNGLLIHRPTARLRVGQHALRIRVHGVELVLTAEHARDLARYVGHVLGPGRTALARQRR